MIPTVGHKNTVETKAQSVMNTHSQTSYQLQLQPRISRNIWGTAVVKLNIENMNSHTRTHSGTHGRTHTFTDTTHTYRYNTHTVAATRRSLHPWKPRCSPEIIWLVLAIFLGFNIAIYIKFIEIKTSSWWLSFPPPIFRLFERITCVRWKSFLDLTYSTISNSTYSWDSWTLKLNPSQT